MRLLIEARLETMLLKPMRKYIDFITGGYYMMLIDWIEKDCQLSEETMAALISEILSSTRSHESYFPKDINTDLKFRILSGS